VALLVGLISEADTSEAGIVSLLRDQLFLTSLAAPVAYADRSMRGGSAPRSLCEYDSVSCAVLGVQWSVKNEVTCASRLTT